MLVKKSPEAFRTISEVADVLDVPPHVLRFWETRFNQVKPVKRGGGRRYYRPQDVQLLQGIRGLLYVDGLTIKGVQKILREKGPRHVIALAPAPDETFPATEEVAAHAASVRKPGTPAAVSDVDAQSPARHRSDLFEEDRVPEDRESDLPPEPVAMPAAPDRKTRLKALMLELEALRARMLDDAAN